MGLQKVQNRRQKLQKAEWFELRGGILVLSNSIDVSLAADLASYACQEVRVYDAWEEVDSTGKRQRPRKVRERRPGMEGRHTGSQWLAREGFLFILHYFHQRNKNCRKWGLCFSLQGTCHLDLTAFVVVCWQGTSELLCRTFFKLCFCLHIQ